MKIKDSTKEVQNKEKHAKRPPKSSVKNIFYDIKFVTYMISERNAVFVFNYE